MTLTEDDKRRALEGRTLAQMHNLLYRLRVIGAVDDDLTETKLRQVDINTRIPSAIDDALKRINLILGTNYKKTHYYNWMSDTVPVPGTVRRIMMREIMVWIYGAHKANLYKGFWS